MDDLELPDGEGFGFFFFEQSGNDKYAKKGEEDIPLTDGGEIDNPLITKYSEFNYPPDLKIARRHGVKSTKAASVSCREQVQPSEKDAEGKNKQEYVKVVLEESFTSCGDRG